MCCSIFYIVFENSLYSPQFFEEDATCASKMRDGMIVISYGGGDLFEITNVMATGRYPRGTPLLCHPKDRIFDENAIENLEKFSFKKYPFTIYP